MAEQPTTAEGLSAPTANCIACNKEFTQRTKWQEFCSQSHRVAWREAIQYLGQEHKDTVEGGKRFWIILNHKLKSADERAAIKDQMRTEEKAVVGAEGTSIVAAALDSETWGDWIKRNYKNESAQQEFINANKGELYISDDQIVGETAQHFLKRTKEGT